jgi:hypothetical protein
MFVARVNENVKRYLFLSSSSADSTTHKYSYKRYSCSLDLPMSIYADDDHVDLKKERQKAIMQHNLSHRPRTA